MYDEWPKSSASSGSTGCPGPFFRHAARFGSPSQMPSPAFRSDLAKVTNVELLRCKLRATAAPETAVAVPSEIPPAYSADDRYPPRSLPQCNGENVNDAVGGPNVPDGSARGLRSAALITCSGA